MAVKTETGGGREGERWMDRDWGGGGGRGELELKNFNTQG